MKRSFVVLIENVVTFWRQDATLVIPRFNWGWGRERNLEDDMDIFFQFRTTVESGTFLHARGLTDELKVVLISPTELQFMFDAGNGPKSLSIHITRPLNDNQWHSVLIERNRKESRLRIDGSFSADLESPESSYRAFRLGDHADLVVRHAYVRRFFSLQMGLFSPCDHRIAWSTDHLYTIYRSVYILSNESAALCWGDMQLHARLFYETRDWETWLIAFKYAGESRLRLNFKPCAEFYETASM